MASSYLCYFPVRPDLQCPLPERETGQPVTPPGDAVIIKNEPADDVRTADGEGASSHDVIKADLGTAPREAPSGRTVLGKHGLLCNIGNHRHIHDSIYIYKDHIFSLI
jgi:hypothetical protein